MERKYECRNCHWVGSELDETDLDAGAPDVPCCPECGSEDYKVINHGLVKP